MQIELMINQSEVNSLYKKQKANSVTFDFVFKDRSSLFNPVIILQATEDISIYNYAYIPEWGRYYFLDPKNVNVIGANRYEITLNCDSLTTFADQIIGIPCIIDRTENYGGSRYIPSEAFVANCKHKTDIIQFPSGLLDNGEFILITAGG